MPATVIISGRVFASPGIMMVGVTKINFAKNHPDNIVPAARRIRAPLRLGSSSLIGESEGIVGRLKKQNSIIRKL